jgi:hypothetical protein
MRRQLPLCLKMIRASGATAPEARIVERYAGLLISCHRRASSCPLWSAYRQTSRRCYRR